ncbi:MAG: Mn transporter [Candidatus Eremiobacter antarcticus]|nr:Nramp family divalent metal transporter [Candidatus Eremiobacteraeota bacterium]MBC5807362.1 Nramp family divalent metal transporter [Candidatus Eremiobacteraeota bacterium]PZR63115.1 MAG: Mn transporter [Candidatus Eremiobacter sp. RRmetagenome_bin22]
MELVETVDRKPRSKRAGPWRSLLIFLSIVGPGLITANIDNDAGGIATYSLAGAQFGFGLLWLLIPVTLALIVIQEMCVRLGVITGKGLADLIRERFGVRITLFIMVGLLLTNLFTTVAEFAGVAASADVFNVSRFVLVTLAAVAVAVLVLRANYKVIEKVFLFACLVYLTYIVSGLLAKPDWPVVLHATVVPTFHWSSAYLAMFIGLIGTTIAPWMQFYIQASVVEKGIKPRELRYSQADVVIGSFITDIVAYFIIVACGATLFVHHVHVTDAGQAALALEPLAGRYAALLFAVGLLNASLFAASVLPLSTAYTVCEAFGFESGIDKRFREAPIFFGLYLAIIGVAALLVLIPGAPLLTLIFWSQVISGMLLPVVVISMLRLVNDRALMGRHVNGLAFNIIAWLTALALIAATGAYLFILIFGIGP